ncbi:MAG TPA: DUF1499 domain-containing protein [Pseudolabrys sp.]|jgi:uncharacterized protein (DUF1499 family)
MARRPIIGDEPVSRLAAWSGRLALFALAVTALSIIIVRSGLLEVVPALTTFAAALVFAALAVLLSIMAFVAIWRQGLSGLGSALLGLFLGLMLLAYPSYLGYRASKLPAISDITTDPGNPPRFDVLARLRPRDRIDYPGGAVAQAQRTAYPDLAPLQQSAPPKLVYDSALALVTKRKWHVVDARPPAAGRREAVIEAVARTPIMGFRDDVVIRVSTTGDGARVDMRSASRYGLHDFGANAARIRSLLEELDDAVNSAPEPRPDPEKKAQPAKRATDKRR